MTSDLDRGIDLQGILQEQLRVRKFHLLVVLNYLPAPKRLVVPGGAVDRDADIAFILAVLPRGRRQRSFQCAENDILADALLIRHGVHNQQDLFAHRLCSLFTNRLS